MMFGSFWNRVSKILTCRRVLYIMMTTAFITNALVTNVFSMAILAMVRDNNATNDTSLFDWNENQKQNVLGVGLWGEMVGKLVNGRLSEVIGPKAMIGSSALVAGLIIIATPQIAVWNYYVLLVSRILVGFFLGSLLPCMFPLTARWFPPEGRSRFLSCTEALFLGIAISDILGGVIISNYGWTSVFYLFGTVLVLWSLFAFILIYDTAEQHPRITTKEKSEIDEQIGDHSAIIKTKFTDVPWKEILTSAPVWAIIITQTTSHFVNVTLVTQLPSYMSQVMQFDITVIGIYASIPFLGKYLAAILFAHVADHMVKSKKISTLSTRKAVETIGQLLPSCCIVLVALFGGSATISLAAFFPMIILNAADVGGHLANILDITPNYSGTISGLSLGFATGFSYFSSIIVAQLLQRGHSFEQWRYLFWILFGFTISGWAVYVCFASSKRQSWDVIVKSNSTEHYIQ